MSKAIIIFSIIGIIIFFGLIITVFIIANQKGWIGSEQKKEEPKINLYLKALDYQNNPTDAEYVLDYGKNIILSKGKLTKDSFTELIVPSNQLVHVYCWNDEHYVMKASKMFSSLEIQQNKSTFTCNMVKIGNIDISHTGNLNSENSIVYLNITTDYWLYHLIVCSSWTAGILSVSIPNQVAQCDKGNWLNYTYYNATTRTYDYLPKDNYRCGDDWFTECDEVEGNICFLLEAEIPARFKNKFDRCWSVGRELFNESYAMEFDIKTENLNQLDKITFFIIDRDRRFIENENQWEFTDFYNDEDIGAKTINYTIEYKS